jgi:hypothetical protein
MTATYQPPIEAFAPGVPAAPDRLAVRHEALTALDSFVRPLVMEKLRLPFSLVAPTIELSLYDAVYNRSSAGGHWTASTRWMGFVGHTIAGYTIALHFDAADRPSHFTIDGAVEVVTDDATPESLGRGLDRARLAGPRITWAPSLPPGISL